MSRGVSARVGPYEIKRELGRGGMGVVYLATDSRLGRSVAIKALSAEFAQDTDRLARFEREARTLAGLNHPNIAGIYGLEESDGRRHLVLEYVEGRTLEERLSAGRMEVEEALRVVRDIALGMEAAHEAGVIHRDLKPANVKITGDGKVKILDFGLAKPADGDGSSANFSSLPTVTASPMTAAGIVMGTAAYMSPEQARGRPLDKRTDIWSLACMLHECLAGANPFAGPTPSDSIAAILEREPDWARLHPRTPTRIRDLLQKCLEKDARNRLRDVGDARIELDRALAAREWTTTAMRAADHPADDAVRLRTRLLAATLVALGVAGVVWAAWIALTDSRIDKAGAAQGSGGGGRAVARFVVNDPALPHRGVADLCTVAISDDGRTIAYAGHDPATGGNHFYLRAIDDTRARSVEVPQEFEVQNAVFSPDGKWLAYYVGGSLHKVPVAGGHPTALFGSPGLNKGAAWTGEGIVTSPSPNSGLVLVSLDGGPAQDLTTLDIAAGEVSHRWPFALPDSSKVLFTIKRTDLLNFDDAEIALVDLKTKERRTVLRGGSFPRYVKPGYLVYGRAGNLMAVRFDAQRGEVIGAPTIAQAGVMTEPGSGAAQFAVARDAGTLVYVPGGPNEMRGELMDLSRDGAITPMGLPPKDFAGIEMSPDGTHLAATVFGASDAIFVYDLARRTTTRVTFRGNCSNPTWSRDSTQILYVSDQDGPVQTYITTADGAGEPKLLFDRSMGPGALVQTAAGPALVYTADRDIWMTLLDQATPPSRLIASQFDERWPSVSADGRWIAYASDENGRQEIYIRPFPSGAGKWQVSRGEGAGFPWWSNSGEEIVYSDGRNLMSVKVAYSADRQQWTLDTPRKLCPIPAGTRLFTFRPDASGFLAVRDLPPEHADDRIVAVLNWPETLRGETSVPPGDRK